MKRLGPKEKLVWTREHVKGAIVASTFLAVVLTLAFISQVAKKPEAHSAQPVQAAHK